MDRGGVANVFGAGHAPLEGHLIGLKALARGQAAHHRPHDGCVQARTWQTSIIWHEDVMSHTLVGVHCAC